MQQAARRRGLRPGANRAPGPAQVGDVRAQFLVGRVLGIGAQDEAPAATLLRLAHQRLHARAQLLARLGRADLLRDADVLVLRQVDQHAAGDRDLRGQPGALGADRVLDHLHGQGLTLEHQPFDRHRGAGLGMVAARRRAVHVQIGHVQEGRAFQADVDEGRLHARQHAHDLARIDVADETALERPLHVQFLHGAVLDDGHPCLLRGPVDQNVFHRRQFFLNVVEWRGPCDRIPQNLTCQHSSSCAVSNSGRPMMPE